MGAEKRRAYTGWVAFLGLLHGQVKVFIALSKVLRKLLKLILKVIVVELDSRCATLVGFCTFASFLFHDILLQNLISNLALFIFISASAK